MQYNSYSKDEKFYIIAMISMILCLGSVLFFLYITPYLIWQLAYDMPDFVVWIIHYLEQEYQFTNGTSRLLVGLLFFAPCLLLGLITYFNSKKYEKGKYVEPLEENLNEDLVQGNIQEEKKQARNESLFFGLKILSLIILCLLFFLVVHSIL